ncbi:bifunctional nitrate reductase/sulfite reductase flavoprotein subunit alpha [Mycobacterium sp. MYCO198283]|uniref:bifunctional nitrate reductase/sulfite reductase flavoprotein subunit alpha n=1 Tax=Mycobacterium sp. MYCO198283 TaxID=2883505 RepID=UPI001E34FDA6|nr:bifunctional nitrate reductase/sulfite reductase flavoprotein subunit alpha [Mycobacterium sp. MYCO198283]MCG5431573.1 bifunctional nitrate reductase/sulfite reductase flavoprotein subunit alpha [Mycobacterium sp. MYCO198283]
MAVTRTACSYCGVGCGIEVQTAPDADTGRPVIARVSGDKLHPANFGRLCTKGATHAELMAAAEGRLTSALLRPRRSDELLPVPVDDAIADAGRRLRAVVDEHGPDAVGIYVSGQMSLESQYLATKLAKGFLRTRYLESNSRLCMASAGTGYKQSLGADGPPGSYTDFDAADLFLVIGSNMADCHPILYLRMMDRRKAGAKLIVVDPRRTTTAEGADLYLPIRAGTDLALLNGLLHLLVEAGAVDADFIAEHTQGWDAMPAFLADYPPARVAELTGLAEADIRRAAELIAEAPNWMTCWAVGANQSTHGTANTNAICNLHLATGAICRPGSGPMSLTGQPNAMGGREMGYMGPGLPGQRSVTSPEDRAFVEDRWGLAPGTIRSEFSAGAVDMFERLAAGDIKACWIICTNPVATMPNRTTTIAGLQAAELVITQDAYRDTATNRYADIVLPAALWAESDQVMVNSERNLTLLAQSVPPVGDARPDWQLICDMAAQLGFGEHFAYSSSAEVFDEIRAFSNPRTGFDLRGASYERLRRTPLQWPVPPENQPGGDLDRHPIRYLNDGVSQDLFVDEAGHRPRLAFPTPSRRAVFVPRPHVEAAELPDDDYPVVLNTGRLQHQWHTMTKTGKVGKLTKLNGAPFVEVNPADAAALGIVDGRSVELASRRGRAVLPAVVTDRVMPGNCFVPFHWNDEHGEHLTINAVTNDAVDPDSLQPEFKVSAVSLRPVETAAAAHPLAAVLQAADVRAPVPDDDEKRYLAAFLAGMGEHPVGVPVLPAAAPVRPEIRLWVDGLLAGRYSRLPAAGAAAADTTTDAATEDAPLVLWASQTGNAEEVAARVAERLGKSELASMNDVPLARLAAARDVVVVTSTFGDGGPPDNGAEFWDRLAATDAPALDHVRYAVLGIGDRSYDNFCGYAKSIDRRLADLGAQQLLDRAEVEAYDDEPMARWAEQVTTLIGDPAAAPAPTAAPPAARPAELFTRNRPVRAPLCRNVLLTPPTAAKEVRQFGFDISEHDVSYAVGDSLGVHAVNSDFAADAWLAATGLRGEEPVEVDGAERTLRDALIGDYDICRVTPDLLRFVAELCPDRTATKVLLGPRKKLDAWLVGRNGIDVVREFPVCADVEQWQDVLVRLTPRQFSISSSPLVSPHEVQLTVSVLRYRGSDGGPRGGVATTFLADRAAGRSVPVFVQRSPHFKPPQDAATPMIMVGPGTGIAPFRGFLQERRALGHTGRNWLFFGDRHRAENFYYRDDLEPMVDDGFLTRLDLAFSRDQQRRIYVQHRMLDAGAELWRWLQDGAHLYVCGDARRMAKDVDAALTEIITRHGGLSAERARDYKRELIAEHRYLRDVY